MAEKSGTKESPPRSSGRSRTQISRFNPNTESKEPKKPVESHGSGSKLGEIESVKASLLKITGDDDMLREFHRVLYGSAGKGTERKKNIRSFTGFKWTKEFPREKLVAKLQDRRWTVEMLKELAHLLNVESKGSKENQVELIADFLEKPHDTGRTPSHAPKGSKKTKRSDATATGNKRQKKKVKKDENKPKRPLSAFFIFSKEERPKLMSKNPDMAAKDVASELGALWRGMNDSQKKKYDAEAKKLKESYTAKLKSYENESASKKTKSSNGKGAAKEEATESDASDASETEA